MINPNYSHSFSVLWDGIKELSICLVNSFTTNFREIINGMWHHKITSILVIGALIFSFIDVAKSRTERDAYNEETIELQQQNDSMKCVLEFRKAHGKLQ